MGSLSETKIGNFDPCEELPPNIVYHHAAVYPDRIWAEVPNSADDYSDGYRKVSYRELANAVNGIAFVSDRLSRSRGWYKQTDLHRTE